MSFTDFNPSGGSSGGGGGFFGLNSSQLGSLSGAVGFGLGGLLGGAAAPAPTVNFTPVGFNAGGLNASFGGNAYNTSADPSRLAAVGGVASTFGQQANALGALAGQYAPGFSNLRQTQLNALNSNRAAAIGNLRDNLAQRRVLGSSFAQDSLANADQTYQNQIAQTMAQTYLQELNSSQQIIQQQYTAARGQFQSTLDEMNFEADLSSKLTAQASTTLENAASVQAQLDAKAAAGTGSFFGSLGQMVGKALPTVLAAL